MTKLNRFIRASVAASLAFASQALWADGTDSGTTVTNGVTLNYSVGAVTQTTTSDVSFVVDRKLRLDVGTPNAAWISAVPGQTGATATSIQFTVANNSNASDVGVVIALIDQSNIDVDGFDPVGAGPIGPTTINVWQDDNGNGVLDGAETSLGSAAGVYALTGDFLEDEIRTISVSIDVPGAAAGELYQTYTLVAAVATSGTVIANDDSSNESPGVADVAAVADDLTTVQDVFADDGATFPEDEGYDFVGGAPGPTSALDGQYDGQASNASGFRTVVVLGIAKHVEVLWDPITGNQYTGTGNTTTGNLPKSIPGAVVMYVIGVSNPSTLAATGVSITDNIPGGGSGDPLLLGNAGAVAGIELPDTVTIDINGTSVVFDLDNTNIDLDVGDSVYARVCSVTVADPVGAPIAFGADPAEVNAVSLGATCPASSTGYIVYFATVDDTAS